MDVAATPGTQEVEHAASETGEETRGERRSEGHRETEGHVSYLRGSDHDPHGVDGRTGGSSSLLGEAPRGHATRHETGPALRAPAREPDLGDLIVILLASTMAGVRDRLAADGFASAAELVADLVDVVDDYLTNVAA